MKAQVTDLGFRRSREDVTGDVYRVSARRVCDLRFRAGRAGRRLPASGDQCGELVGGRRAHPGHQVLVGVHGEAGMGVAEALADHLHRDAGGDEQRSMGMANIMESDARDRSAAGRPDRTAG